MSLAASDVEAVFYRKLCINVNGTYVPVTHLGSQSVSLLVSQADRRAGRELARSSQGVNGTIACLMVLLGSW